MSKVHGPRQKATLNEGSSKYLYDASRGALRLRIPWAIGPEVKEILGPFTPLSISLSLSLSPPLFSDPTWSLILSYLGPMRVDRRPGGGGGGGEQRRPIRMYIQRLRFNIRMGRS